MKRMSFFAAVTIACLGSTFPVGAQTSASSGTAAPSQTTVQSQSGDDSLGNYARSMRKDKKPTAAKRFDNDNLPTNDQLSVVGNTGAEQSQTQPAGDQNGSDDSVKHTPTAEEQQKANDEWKDKLSDQKSKIDLLSRELDVAQREYKLREAAMYGDAGNRLRNSSEWDKEDSQYKQQIADKQKALDDAKKQMDDMQEQARKAGVPTSERE